MRLMPILLLGLLFLSGPLAWSAGQKSPIRSQKPQSTIEPSVALPLKYEVAFKRMKEQRQNVPCDRPIRTVQRHGDKTIGIESFLCVEGSFESMRKIATDFGSYGQWVLNNINERPTGGSYFIQFLDISAPNPDHVLLKYKVDFPFLKKERQKHFKVKSETFPRAFVLTGEGVEDAESLLNYARAEMVVFPAPKTDQELWLYVQGKAQLKSSFIYEALPEKILRSEAGDRLQRIADNYHDRELAVRAPAN
jgi:hypothetical protein